MKKYVAIAVVFILALIGAYKYGIHHAMTESEFWILEFGDSAPYDYNVHVLIDGAWYEHGIYVG